MFVRLLLLAICLTSACTPSGKSEAPVRGQLSVSILPQKFFVKRIAGDLWRVQVMIPPAYNPATYEPLPGQLKALSRSEIYFRIGHIPFEMAWSDKLTAVNPSMRVIDTSRGVSLIAGSHHHADTLRPDHHHPEGIDPHIWLSPTAVRTQIGHISAALISADPEHGETYQRNHDALLNDIAGLERELTARLNPYRGKKIMAFHPAWSYFCREFGLLQISIQHEGKDPTPGELARLVDTAVTESIGTIFVQKQFDTHQAATIAREVGAVVVTLDPLAEDWLTNMKRIAEAFVRAFEEGK
jgi:zinc transport system substrate-binding protein